MLKRLLLAVAVLSVLGGPANATPILFNTGVDDSGTPLPDGTIGDPHYTLITVPTGSTTDIRVRTSAGGWPIPPWIGDNSISAWIGPDNDTQLDGPAGDYVYRTTFDLTGVALSAVSIDGQWSTDNGGRDILINGTSLGYTQGGFGSWAAFSVTSGFVDGLNTLDFIVRNSGGPTGLRVETQLAVVPEPASLTLLMLGVGAAGYYRGRRKTKIAPSFVRS